MGRDISVTDTAKLAKQELGKAFPGVIFSVKSKKYSGGSSIDVSWTDGPTREQAESVAGLMHGGEFDGMTDLKYYNDRPYMNDYIFFNRHISEHHLRARAARIVKEWGFQVDPNDLDKYSPVIWEKCRQHSTLGQFAFHELSKETLPV